VVSRSFSLGEYVITKKYPLKMKVREKKESGRRRTAFTRKEEILQAVAYFY